MFSKHLILGISDGGLFLARQLRKQWPQCLIYAIGQVRDIGQYSNCIDCFYSIEGEKDLCITIRNAYNKMGGGEVFAYCCSNPMLEWVVRHEDLFDMLTFENSFSFYKTIMDKRQVTLLCDECSVLHPQEFSFTIEHIDQLPYPVVVKPLQKMVDVLVKKCTYISSVQSMKSFLEKVEATHVDKSNLVCQQAILGDNRWEYGYGGYFQDGEPLIDVCFHQFRQHPQGLCTYIREMTDEKLADDIRNLVKPLLYKIRANGFVEFDIKQDSETKLLYLLDINPRPWRSVDMLTVKLDRSTVFDPKPIDCYVEWQYPWKAFFSKKNSRNVSQNQCKQITGTDNFTKFVSMTDRKDPNPLRQHKWETIRAFLEAARKNLISFS